MTIYYSASTLGFYNTEINTEIPSDAVEITEQYYNELINAQSNGKKIELNSEGYPIAVDPPAPTPEEIASQNKATASSLLAASDWATKSSISNPEQSTPYLMNQQAFFDYQNQLRAIAVNPPITPVENWPVEPKAVWS